MKNFVQPGKTITLPAPYARASGEGALVGSIFGIANGDVANGADGEFDVVGVFDINKTPAQAWTVGARVYWDNAAKEVTTTVGSNTLIGVAVLPASNPSATGRVRLNGAF